VRNDYWSARQLKWIAFAIIALSAAAGLAVWLAEHEPYKVAFHKYLDAIAAGRIEDAYEQLCPESKQAMPNYAERVNLALAETGRIQHRTGPSPREWCMTITTATSVSDNNGSR
jgi:hypothetical protein